MDELVIDDKKYISSKQAAKLTGYAKDYVGQLCREGRVSARLVGRSWYVLESAIQDHRFGDTPQEARHPVQTARTVDTPPPTPTPTPTPTPAAHNSWENPRYEPAHSSVLPPINRIQHEQELDIVNEAPEPTVSEPVITGYDVPTQPHEDEKVHIQNAWEDWHSGVVQRGVEPVVDAERESYIEDRVEEPSPREEVHLPQRDESYVGTTMPIRVYEPESYKDQKRDTAPSGGRAISGFYTAVRVIGVIIALAVASIAAINSGKFDTYLVSDSRVNYFAGINVINNIVK